MLISQIPLMEVVLPLIAAPVCLLLPGRQAFRLVLAVIGANLAGGIALLSAVSVGGAVDYQFGGWPPPWGIAYHVDLLGAFVLLIVNLITVLVISPGRVLIEQQIDPERRRFFYATLLLVLTGFNGILMTADAFNLFVFLEISSLASYGLVSMGPDRRALRAAFQYLMLGSVGASFILIGVGFLYMMTGTLNMADMAERLPPLTGTTTVRAGLAFLTVGIGLKLAVFPLHLWLPNAYQFAPSVVSAFLAATATKVAVYILLRFILSVFGVQFALQEMPLGSLLLVLGAGGVLFASAKAVLESSVKRLLAYSSVAQLGYMVVGLGLASEAGITASVLHLFNHALMKAALFLAVAMVVFRLGADKVRDFSGLGRAMPWTMAAFTLAGLSLIGVPLTIGFISKWYLLDAALEQGLWALAVVILAGSLLALAYVWKVLEAAYFNPLPAGRQVTEVAWPQLVPLWLLVAANLYFGVDTTLTVDTAARAAQLLQGGGS